MKAIPFAGPLRLALLLALFAAAALGARDAQAFDICGNGVCVPPFETATTCPVDCGTPPYCGDGICNNGETCGTCLGDCADRCITFNLFDALKKNQCANDDDGDCLDNDREQDLAFLFAPRYYYDEDESCAGAFYTDDPDPLHFGRRDFYQVRPRGNPAAWTTTNGKKNVTLTYFLLHPHDCQERLGFAGHQGDSEHVVFHLSSLDLRRWTLVKADFHHHNLVHTFSGGYLKQRASEAGTLFPNVAADQNGHGSWPGRVGSSADCAGSEDAFCHTTCDCFRGTMAQARSAGFNEFVSTTRNIGGPPPERFRSPVVTVFGQHAFSVLDVGHGNQIEAWTPVSGFQRFCGWECPSRGTDGNCTVSVHSRSGCSSPLSEKVDTTFFTAPPPSLGSLAPEPVTYDSDESARLGARVHGLLNGLSHLPVAAIDGLQAQLAAAADPIGEIAPLVAGRPREAQLQTLEWVLLEVPEKLEAAVAPGLLPAEGLTPGEIEAEAAELVAGLAGLLREAGYGRERR